MNLTVSADPGRLRIALTWVVPSCAFLALYHQGLWCWFHTDDFSLLWQSSLPTHEFIGELLQPRAQGTFRPLSERLFFFTFYRWFGLDAFPYRLLVFATQIVNLGLLATLVRRLTGSALAAGFAASLWGLHHALATTMSWSSAYNQALCSTFLLGAILLFARFCETGGMKFYWAQLLFFVLGFGALETTVVYPALALAYALLFARKRWLFAAPMFGASLAFAMFQSSMVRPSEQAYTLQFNVGSLFSTAWSYIELAFVAQQTPWLLLATAVPLLIATLVEARKRSYVGLFGWVWFAVTLGPYLPLASHISDYYLFIPAAGLALAAGGVAAQAWRGGALARVLTIAPAAVFIWAASPAAAEKVDFFQRMSAQIRNMATGVVHARAQHPNKTILLARIPSEVFYASVYHDLFPLVGVYDVYLAPDLVELEELPGYETADEHFLSPQQTLLGIRRDSLVVYDASQGRLREITSRYRAFAPVRLMFEAAEEPDK